MAKIRVYELARELEVDSKDVLEQAHELDIAVKTASSGLEETDADLIRLAFADETPAEEPAPSEPTPAAEARPEEGEEGAGPVHEGAEAVVGVATAEVEEAPVGELRPITLPEGITAGEFAREVGVPVGAVVKSLLQMGEMVAAAAAVPAGAIEDLGGRFGVAVTVEEAAPVVPEVTGPKPKRVFDDDPADLVARPAVVTVMGHVDHGKTTLLDAIRHTNVVAGEHGGITQHIGAYQVDVDGRKITFIDTPGHEAFTALRARGAEVTDIVILVVAADDGVMPQTAEAISHTKAAEVPMIVAINKMDLAGADPYAVRAALTEQGVVAEELGGDTITVEVSAAAGQGLDQLLEMIDLVAQLEELAANPEAPASGVVIESQLDPGMGPVATVIVQRGTLRQGDSLVAGPVAGRVRAMLDHQGNRQKQAGPSTPVLVMGWSDVPTAGDLFDVVGSDKEARAIAQKRADQIRAESVVAPTARERLESLLEQLRTADEAELRLIIKADAHGSLEALRESIGKIGREGGSITIVHGAVGGISENDVTLADVTESIIVGFSVRPDAKARRAAEEAGVEIRTFQVIYELLDDIEKLLVGKLAPTEVEVVRGSAEVRALFRVPRAGTIAGSYVTEGEVVRGARARLVREGVVVYDGTVSSLRRFKDDVRSVSSGFECGIGLAGFNDIKEGDVIEVYEIKEVAAV